MTCTSIYLKRETSTHFCLDSDCDHLSLKTNKQKADIDGLFTLIISNKIHIHNFNFKENLIGKEETFVRVNAIIDNHLVIGFIDLKKYPLLLDRVKLLTVEEATQKINEFAFDTLCPGSILVKDTIQLANSFDMVFLGDTVEEKIASYEFKKRELQSGSQCLIFLNKIFINGLAIKIFQNQIIINKLENYNFIEFKIANQAKDDLRKAIFKASFCGCESLLLFLLSNYKDKENLGLLFTNAASYGQEYLVKNIFEVYSSHISDEDLKQSVINAVKIGHEPIVNYLLLKKPSNSGIALRYAAYEGKEGLVKNLFEKYGDRVLTEDLAMAVINAVKIGHESIVDYLLSKNLSNLGIAISIAAYKGKEDLVKNIFENYGNRISVKDLKMAVINAGIKGYESIVSFLLIKLIRIQIPMPIKEAILEIRKLPPNPLNSWERLLGKILFFVISMPNSELKYEKNKILNQTYKRIKKELSFLGTPKEDNRELLSGWYAYIKNIMAKIDQKIDFDSSKDIEEKNNLLDAFELCGGAWQFHLDQMKQRLVDFPKDAPVELFIGKIISDMANRVSEFINKEYAQNKGKYPDIHDQNRIRFYLKDYLIDEVLDDHLSSFSMNFGQVMVKFSEKFNLETIIDEILESIKENLELKGKLDDYYENQLFKGCSSNDEIELKIGKDLIELEIELQKLEENQGFFHSLNSIIGFMPFLDQIKVLNLLFTENKVLFNFNLKKIYSGHLLTDEKINELFSQREKATNFIIFLNKIKSFCKSSYQEIIMKTKDQLIQLFIDNKQSRVEFYLVEDFISKHVKDGDLLASGLSIILKKIGFLNT